MKLTNVHWLWYSKNRGFYLGEVVFICQIIELHMTGWYDYNYKSLMDVTLIIITKKFLTRRLTRNEKSQHHIFEKYLNAS